MFEALENRQMFSVMGPALGMLFVHGTSAADLIQVDRRDAQLNVYENGALTRSLPESKVGVIYIWGNEGSDRITATSRVTERLVVSGGAGHDYIEGGSGHDTLYGDAGQDIVYGVGGNDLLRGRDDVDYLDGGAGNDTLYGGAGNDSVYGMAGDDKLYGEDGSDRIDDLFGTNQIDGGAGYDYGRASITSTTRSFEGRM
jgi:Ca2+-binding RTX toxin-like protein